MAKQDHILFSASSYFMFIVHIEIITKLANKDRLELIAVAFLITEHGLLGLENFSGCGTRV